jgi:spore coat polysaccharide biosynthesis protein SpsF (cytidylyltransferase family)
MIPPLCIIQCRLNSTRLPQKMLAELGDETLIARAYRMAVAHFGDEHVVVAIPFKDWDGPLGDELRRVNARVMTTATHEADVLGRFYEVARTYRWRPESVLHRWTPDDPWKNSLAIMRAVNGERVSAETGGEAFTLAMLEHAHATVTHPHHREHITYALYGSLPPSPPPGQTWTIDTQSDLDACRAMLAQREAA